MFACNKSSGVSFDKLEAEKDAIYASHKQNTILCDEKSVKE